MCSAVYDALRVVWVDAGTERAMCALPCTTLGGQRELYNNIYPVGPTVARVAAAAKSETSKRLGSCGPK